MIKPLLGMSVCVIIVYSVYINLTAVESMKRNKKTCLLGLMKRSTRQLRLINLRRMLRLNCSWKTFDFLVVDHFQSVVGAVSGFPFTIYFHNSSQLRFLLYI